MFGFLHTGAATSHQQPRPSRQDPLVVENGAWSQGGNTPSNSAPEYIQSLADTASQPHTSVAEYRGGAASAPHMPMAHPLERVASHHCVITPPHAIFTHTHTHPPSGASRLHGGHQCFPRGQDHPGLSPQQHPQPGTRWQLSMQQKQQQRRWRQQQHLALLTRPRVSPHTSTHHAADTQGPESGARCACTYNHASRHWCRAQSGIGPCTTSQRQLGCCRGQVPF